MSVKITRRDALKLSGAAASGLALGGTASAWDEMAPPPGLTQQNSYFQSLKPMRRDEPLGAHEMRITFMGTSVIERRAQQRSSLFVELGNGECFVFDCGSGAVSNYVAMGVPWSRMSRIFLTHLHGDHTSDLTHIYCFGPQGDRKFPLYIWGPSKSGVPNPAYVPGDPGNPQFFDDGTIEFCKHFREMNRWHTESQSFVPTRFLSAEGDGYDIFTTELDWRHGTDVRYWTTNDEIPNPSDAMGDAWTAYSRNGVRVSYFPVIHDRNGSIGYRLDWLTEGLSMIFTGDTKPSWRLVHEAAAGERPVDVLVSEVVVDPEVWIERPSGLTEGDDRYAQGLLNAQAVQENSHTPQKALGYILRQLADGHKAPRLAVATHFQATDDTISLALKDIRSWYAGPVTFAMDLMVVRVTQASVVPYRAVVSDYSWSAPQARGGQTCDPKYADTRDCNYYAPMAPLAQFDDQLLDDVIAPEAYDPGGWQDLNNNGPCQDRGPSRPAGRPPRPAAPSPQA